MRLFVSRRVGPLRVGASFGPEDFRRRRVRSSAALGRDQVYVVQGRDAVKIGVTSDLDARLAQLQTGSPYTLDLVYSTRVRGDAYAVEREAHDMLDRHRLSGEWFAVPPDVAVAAINGAAFRLAPDGSGVSRASGPNWLKRIAVIALATAPQWVFATINQPLGFFACGFVAAVFLIFCLLRTEATGRVGFTGFLKWCGAVVLGLAAGMVVGLGFGPFVGGARADDRPTLPDYDVPGYCTKVAAIIGDNPLLKEGCLSGQADARRDLERVWGKVPAKIENECLRMLAIGAPQNYQALSGCLAGAVGNYWMRGDLKIVPGP